MSNTHAQNDVAFVYVYIYYVCVCVCMCVSWTDFLWQNYSVDISAGTAQICHRPGSGCVLSLTFHTPLKPESSTSWKILHHSLNQINNLSVSFIFLP